MNEGKDNDKDKNEEQAGQRGWPVWVRFICPGSSVHFIPLIGRERDGKCCHLAVAAANPTKMDDLWTRHESSGAFIPVAEEGVTQEDDASGLTPEHKGNACGDSVI